MRTPVTSLLLGLLGLSQVAHAGILGRNRYHALDPKGGVPGVRKRLSLEARKNVSAVGRYRQSEFGWGSANLVYRGNDGYGIVLTNAHVAGLAGKIEPEDDGGAGRFQPKVEFGSQKSKVSAEAVRVLVSVPELDYALVLVKLPKRLKTQPVQIDARGEKPGGRVYRAGFDDLSDLFRMDTPKRSKGEPWSFDSSGRDDAFRELNRDYWKDDRLDVSFQTIQTGKILFDSKQGKRVASPYWVGMPVQLADLASWSGGSGSGVFDVESHALVGINHGGASMFSLRTKDLDQRNARRVWATGSGSITISSKQIVDDLRDRAAKGKLGGKTLAPVRALLSMIEKSQLQADE